MIRVLYVGCGFCSAKTLAADLPELLRNHADVDVIVPHLDGIDEGVGKLAERLIDCKADIQGNTVHVKVLEGRRENHVRAFYLDAPALRKPLSLDSDDGIQATCLFAHAVCSWMMQVPVAYDIVHCDGILTALVPMLLKNVYANVPRAAAVKSLVVLPGIEDKGCIDMAWLRKLGLPDSLASSEGVEFYGKLSILKGVYLFADAIAFPNDLVKNKIERNRGKDIGMEGILFRRANVLHHIAIGSDPRKCNPGAGFDTSAKAKAKASLAQKLRIKKDRPIVTFIGALSPTSGIDLVNDILDDLMDRQVSLVIVGSGTNAYNAAVEGWKNEFKGCIAWLKDKPDVDNIKKLLAASDILLLPTKSESLCRIHQIAMKSGCVVVARNHGCIANDIHSVANIDKVSDKDNGFTFRDYDSDQFFDAVMDALDLFGTPDWNDIRTRAMDLACSLDKTAEDCIHIYNSLLS